jgi:hypothetical protein
MALDKIVTLSTGTRIESSKLASLSTFKAVVKKKAGSEDKAGRREFEMGISHLSADREKEVISKKAWDKSIERFMSTNPAGAIGHVLDAAEAVNIARITAFRFDGKQAVAEGYLGRTGPATDVWMNLEDDIPMQASIAFQPRDARSGDAITVEEKALYGDDVERIYDDMDILHFGIVNVGMHPKTYTRRKGLEDIFKGPGAEQAGKLMDDLMGALNAAATAGNALLALVGGEADPNAPPPPAPAKALSLEDALEVIRKV